MMNEHLDHNAIQGRGDFSGIEYLLGKASGDCTCMALRTFLSPLSASKSSTAIEALAVDHEPEGPSNPSYGGGGLRVPPVGVAFSSRHACLHATWLATYVRIAVKLLFATNFT